MKLTQKVISVELPKTPRAARGLGDIVAIVAQPVAKALDTAFNTNIQKCGGCKNRQQILNKIAPKLF